MTFIFDFPWILVGAGLIALFIGGELFVSAAIDLGRRLGLSELFVGLAIVGFGTSAAELAVSIDAALQGSSDIALANVIGSNIANVALVLGITALIMPIRVDPQSLRRDIPVMLIASFLLVVLLADGSLSRMEGACLLGGLILYLVVAGLQARRPPSDNEPDVTDGVVGFMLCKMGLGVVLLVVGSHWLVTGARTISTELGITEAVIGVTVVAIGTSLPEIAVSVVAALRGKTDMALGNIVGSNIWNILAVLGTASIIVDLPKGNVGWMMLGFMIVTALLLTLMARTGLRVSRPEGAVLLLTYAGVQMFVIATGRI